MDPHGVLAVVFDASVLFRVDSTGSVQLVSGAARFLLRLRGSFLRTMATTRFPERYSLVLELTGEIVTVSCFRGSALIPLGLHRLCTFHLQLMSELLELVTNVDVHYTDGEILANCPKLLELNMPLQLATYLILQQEALLEEVGVSGAIRIISLSQELTVSAALENLVSLWGVPTTSSVYVSANQSEVAEADVSNLGWTVLNFVAGDSPSEILESCDGQSDTQWFSVTFTTRMVTGSKEKGSQRGAVGNAEQLQEIPVILASLNKKALGTRSVVVGYTMKWSRELDFLKRGAFPLVPNQYGLSFIPIHLDRPLDKQLAGVDVVLQKATDETLSIPPRRFGSPDSVRFSKGMLDLQRYLQGSPNICVVDPIDRILPLLDRVATQKILRNLNLPFEQTIRPPRSVEVTTFEEPLISQALASTNIELPAIVKPQIACGASVAHTMAVVFKKEGFNGLSVPLPAVIQEYVDHGACQYKMYIVGEKLFCSCRKSTPNAEALADANDDAPAIVFDSLKSLPIADSTGPLTNSGGGFEDLNSEAVQATADWLRSRLGLTIVGFDVVVDAGTSDYVVVDVNFFPSFKDVPDAEAIPAFWDALVTAHRQWPTCYV